jgi:hypothetical protein
LGDLGKYFFIAATVSSEGRLAMRLCSTTATMRDSEAWFRFLCQNSTRSSIVGKLMVRYLAIESELIGGMVDGLLKLTCLPVGCVTSALLSCRSAKSSR